MRPTPSTLPSRSTISAFKETAMTVPIVSNISTKRNVNTTISISHERIWLHSNWRKMGAIEGGVETILSKWVTPIGMPMRAVRRIPHRRPPMTFRTTSSPQMTRPMSASRMEGLLKVARATCVLSLETMIPQFCRPIKAIKRPMPPPMAAFNPAGMALAISSRTLKRLRMIKRIPSMKTAVNANCQVWPIPRQTVKTKKALMPMPGASPNGFLA